MTYISKNKTPTSKEIYSALKNEYEMKDCSQHKKEVAGLKPPELSKAIVSMHYEALVELIGCLHQDFREAGYIDYENGKTLLNEKQQMISACMLHALPRAEALWQISKPFMEDKNSLK